MLSEILEKYEGPDQLRYWVSLGLILAFHDVGVNRFVLKRASEGWNRKEAALPNDFLHRTLSILNRESN
jgi:hypothetical protein